MKPSDGILGRQYWSEITENKDQYSPARTGAWVFDLLRPAVFDKKPSATSRRLKKTAYLDGLRGFAALLVYFGHHQLWAHASLNPESIFENAYGYNKQYYFATLPGIRIFFSGGHLAVSVFFVISGYVLSLKPLHHIHSRDHSALSHCLASSFFRRWLRLFMPIVCVTFLYMALWHVFGIRTDVIPKKKFSEELWRWYKEFRDFSFVFKAEQDHDFTKHYGFHLWSIPVEFRGSVVIYTFLLALSTARRNARLVCAAGVLFYFLYIVDGWYCAMFISGMMLCDLDMLAEENNLPAFISKRPCLQQSTYYILFLMGIVLGGCPAASPDTRVLIESPGWYYLAVLKPQAIYDYKWFFLFCAATCLVASIPRIAILKRFFECRFNQYLGKISFAFYLVHGPVLWLVGDKLYAATGCTRAEHAVNAARWVNIALLPRVGPLGLELNFVAPHLLLLPLTLWAGEIATKLFDEPSVTLSRWLYDHVLDHGEF